MKENILKFGIIAIVILGSFFDCSDDSDEKINVSIPTVGITRIWDMTTTTAICEAEVVSDGGGNIISRGFCFSIEYNPDLEDFTTNEGGGTGAFASQLNSLTPGTVYWVRAYVTNSKGTGYSSARGFSTRSN